jgi:hypothetical protein
MQHLPSPVGAELKEFYRIICKMEGFTAKNYAKNNVASQDLSRKQS